MCNVNQAEKLTLVKCNDCMTDSVAVAESHTGNAYCTGCMTNERLKETQPELYIKAMQEVIYFTIDFSKLSDVEIDGIDMADYGDFCDAYISYAEYDGVPMTDAQLENLANMDGYSAFVNETIFDQM
jgi:hypothetical protein